MHARALAGLLLLLPAAAPAATSGGTGFFLGGDRLATAAHVVAACAAVTVEPEHGPVLPARVLSRDAERDVAVLEVPGMGAPAPDLAGSAAAGEVLAVVGYPHAAAGGELRSLPLTVITLPIPRPPDRMPLHGPVAEPGLSGAPLIDGHGRVAGMLLGRGDPMAPPSADLAQRVGYPIEEIAIALPAEWLTGQDMAINAGPVVIARVLCILS